jgi:hypothetical protein
MSHQSPYQEYKDKTCVKGSVIIHDAELNPDGIITLALYKKWCRDRKEAQLQKGGNGRTALFALDAIPEPYYSQVIARWGNPNEIHNPLQSYFQISAEARQYYQAYRREDGLYLKKEQIDRYTVNASVLNALATLEQNRRASRRGKGGSTHGIWASLASDVAHFNGYLKTKYNVQHSLPANELRLRAKLRDYRAQGYEYLVDKRNANANAQKVTPLMLELWTSIYAGQHGRKPNYTEVYVKYMAFRAGKLDIINNSTGEVYNHLHEDYRDVTDRTVLEHQSTWSSRVSTAAVRSGDRQVHMNLYKPYHKLIQPRYAGSIISIDDRQPPFEYAPGKRMWFYLGIDLGSECFTTGVYGETKEGIIEDFYRQMLRNYHEWNLPLPLELEAESSLNSSYVNTFLQDGVMFQHTRIEANNARGKRIERYFKNIRYGAEKEIDGWIARPFAKSESNQKGAHRVPLLPKEEIIQNSLAIIEQWNNTLHSDQTTHPGMTRWQVLREKQNPNAQPINWTGILPHLGFVTPSSMKAGRITLQGKQRVVGHGGQVALGDDLIRIMSDIEGEAVTIYWMDDNQGEVIQAHVYDQSGRMICELLGDLGYSRAISERTPEQEQNRTLMSAYVATVEAFAKRGIRKIKPVTLIQRELPERGAFRMPGVKTYIPNHSDAEVIETPAHHDDLIITERNFSTKLEDRF